MPEQALKQKHGWILYERDMTLYFPEDLWLLCEWVRRALPWDDIAGLALVVGCCLFWLWLANKVAP